jgi:P27 family predicted phage terminase small subunit
MGRRGPPPKPTAVKKLEGNPGKRRLPKDEPAPPAEEPSCPSWLTREAREEWARITPILRSMRLLSSADEVTLAAYCQAAAELQLATRHLDEVGRYHDDSKQAMRAQRDAFARVKSFLQEFGLSPSARARLSTPAGKDEPDELGKLVLAFADGAA